MNNNESITYYKILNSELALDGDKFFRDNEISFLFIEEKTIKEDNKITINLQFRELFESDINDDDIQYDFFDISIKEEVEVKYNSFNTYHTSAYITSNAIIDYYSNKYDVWKDNVVILEWFDEDWDKVFYTHSEEEDRFFETPEDNLHIATLEIIF